MMQSSIWNEKAAADIVFRNFADIQEKAAEWLWNGYLPKGMLTILGGAGGCGKSTLAVAFAATVANGGIWPDGTSCSRKGNVAIWSSEDLPDVTIKPRLLAAGLEPDNRGTWLIEGSRNANGDVQAFDPAKDMTSLRSELSYMGEIDLLILDPIVSVVAGDMHRANDVRRSLQPLVDLAAELNCAVVGITHFAKNTAGKNSTERVIGSQAFSAVSRMVLVAAKDEESERRVLTRSKSNVSEDGEGFEYSIEALTLPSGIPTTRVKWGEQIEGSARNILSDVEGDEAQNGTSKADVATSFLCRILANGPLAAQTVVTESLRQGIAPATLRRAREKLRIKPEKGVGDMRSGWMWTLPTL